MIPRRHRYRFRILGHFLHWDRLYLAKDGKLSERLVFIVRADASHWRGMDLVKNEHRCFRREGLAVAELVESAEQQKAILDRLTKGGNGTN